MLKMVDGTGIIGVDMVCPLGGAVSPPQPPNFDKVEMEGVGSLMLPNSLKAPLERVELLGNSVQGENPAPDNPQEIKSAGRLDEASGKYLLDVKVTGRNILSDVKGMYNIFVPCPIKAGTTVTLITNGVESDGGNILFTTDSGEDYWYAIDKGVTKVARSINKNVIGFKNLLQKKDGLKYCLVIGDTDNYKPYTEQSMQIALNEPLRGIGEYKDTITKDGVMRKIKRVVLDGSEDEEWRLDRKLRNHINFALVIKGAITVNTGIRTMMDKFKYLRAVWNNNLPGQDMFGAKLRINMPKTLATDLQTFKTWLSQNPLTVDYVLAEPVTEPLPGSVQAQLQALHSENGTTHVFVDSGEVPCGIKLTYRKEI